MVKIKIVKNKLNEPCSISASGHAGFAEHGSDIVCSAVSVLMQTIALGFERLGAGKGFYNISDGNMKIIMPLFDNQSDTDKAVFLFETAEEAFKEIANSYKGFVKVSSCIK